MHIGVDDNFIYSNVICTLVHLEKLEAGDAAWEQGNIKQQK